MNHRSRVCGAFSLVEVTLALGVAAFFLIAIMGLLPVGLKTNQDAIQQTTANGILSAIVSDIRTTPKGDGQWSKHYKLVFPNVHPPNDPPRFLYFSNEGSTGLKADQPTPDTVFYVTIVYTANPTGWGLRTATLLDVKVAWPYAGITAPTAGPTPAGFVETFLSVDRN